MSPEPSMDLAQMRAFVRRSLTCRHEWQLGTDTVVGVIMPDFVEGGCAGTRLTIGGGWCRECGTFVMGGGPAYRHREGAS